MDIKHEMARTIEILPQLMKTVAEGFEPQLEIKLKKIEVITMMHLGICRDQPMKFYAEKIGLENGSFTYLADKLQELGYIERVNVKEDRRKKIITLTEEGKRVHQRIQEQFIEHMSKKFEVFTDEEKEKYIDFLNLGQVIVNILKDREYGNN